MTTNGTQPGGSVPENIELTAPRTDRRVIAQAAAVLKDVETLRAQFALRGHGLHQSGTGYYVERWGMVRDLPTLEDVRKFLAQIGGAA